MSATLSSRLLDAAVSDARSVLASAQATDIHNNLDVIRSHATLTATLERVLWTLGAEDEPDVAAQVDAEDGVSRPVFVRYQRDEVAA
ncbi:hypothetical protein ACIOEX_01195 [Streptomyces sp. NPDC087850]|uniref:hypothetical protein n=1 Tax=Streptomyces sp. NPDC087850 TaxID=3365809 RepID=UPI00382BD13A